MPRAVGRGSPEAGLSGAALRARVADIPDVPDVPELKLNAVVVVAQAFAQAPPRPASPPTGGRNTPSELGAGHGALVHRGHAEWHFLGPRRHQRAGAHLAGQRRSARHRAAPLAALPNRPRRLVVAVAGARVVRVQRGVPGGARLEPEAAAPPAPQRRPAVPCLVQLGAHLPVHEAEEHRDEEALEGGEGLVEEEPDGLHHLIAPGLGGLVVHAVRHAEEESVVRAEQRHQHQRRLGPAPVPPRLVADRRLQLLHQHPDDVEEQQEVDHDRYGDGHPDQQEDDGVLVGGPAHGVVHVDPRHHPRHDEHRRQPPAEGDVQLDGGRVGEQGQEDEVVQVEPLHQDPRVVGHDEVLPEAGDQLAHPILVSVDEDVGAVLEQQVRRQPDAVHEQARLEQREEGAHDEGREQVQVQHVPRAPQLLDGGEDGRGDHQGHQRQGVADLRHGLDDGQGAVEQGVVPRVGQADDDGGHAVRRAHRVVGPGPVHRQVDEPRAVG